MSGNSRTQIRRAHGVVDGVECEHLAFRTTETDWQIWIERGPHPIPRKFVIANKHVNAAPQYTLRIKEWKTDPTAGNDSFAFAPPARRPIRRQRDADPLVRLMDLIGASPHRPTADAIKLRRRYTTHHAARYRGRRRDRTFGRRSGPRHRRPGADGGQARVLSGGGCLWPRIRALSVIDLLHVETLR